MVAICAYTVINSTLHKDWAWVWLQEAILYMVDELLVKEVITGTE